MTRTGDPERDAMRRDYEDEKWLAARPVCISCGDPIQEDHYYDIGDGPMCERCMYGYVSDCRHQIE